MRTHASLFISSSASPFQDLFNPSTICAAAAVLPLRISLMSAIVSCSSDDLLAAALRTAPRARRRSRAPISPPRGFRDRLVDDPEVLVERGRRRADRAPAGWPSRSSPCRRSPSRSAPAPHRLPSARPRPHAGRPPAPAPGAGVRRPAAAPARRRGTSITQRHADREHERGREASHRDVPGAEPPRREPLGRMGPPFLTEPAGDLQPRAIGRRAAAGRCRRRVADPLEVRQQRAAVLALVQVRLELGAADRVRACRRPAPGSV